MAYYNIYIKTLAIGKETFFVKIQKKEFFLEYLGAVAKIKSDFA